MSEDFDAYIDSFREEAAELLSDLEDSLLELEENPEDMDRVAAAFRVMHTLKGGAGMFGLDDITSVTHKVETAFDKVRNGALKVTKPLIDLTLQVCDLIKDILRAPKNIDPENKVRIKELTDTCESIMSGGSAEEKPDVSEKKTSAPPGETESVDKSEKEARLYRIRFTLSADSVSSGSKPSELIQELSKLGELTVVSKWNDVPEIQESDPEYRFSKWDLILSSSEEINNIRGVFIFIENDCEVQIDPADDSLDLKKLGAIIVDKSFALEGDVEKALGAQSASSEKKLLGEMLVDDGIISKEQRDSAVHEQDIVKELKKKEHKAGPPVEAEPEELSIEAIKKELEDKEKEAAKKEAAKKEAAKKEEKKNAVPLAKKIVEKMPSSPLAKKDSDVASSIRVPSLKLDALVDLISELVTVQANLSQTSERRKDPELLQIAEEVERLTAELRDNTMNIRMVTIGTLFSKFKRLVRDLANTTGKSVDFVTEGEDTELDKTVVEKLNDPLLHLIRNSVDHGIESAEERKSTGKPVKGTIRISATQAGSDVMITLEDDGQGLDPVAIRNKARERGLMGETEELPDKNLFEFLFNPGFSTAKKVTNLSGRGVGLDVVKRNMDALRGSFDTASKKGAGTTFTLILPLTLAIIDGLLVTIGRQYFVIPISSVTECVELKQDDAEKSHGRLIAKVREELIPYVFLKERFEIPGERQSIEQIVVVGLGGKRVGFVVDQVIGKHQTVIKTLGRVYREVRGVSGATILGDGTVALILDVNSLIKIAEQEEALATAT